jgi:hypothetical protein
VRLRRQPHGFFIPPYGYLILPHGYLARPYGFFGRPCGYADNRTVYRFYRTVYLLNRAGFWAYGAKWSRNRMGFSSQRALPYPRRRPCSIKPSKWRLQRAALLLLPFDALEQCLEVASAKATCTHPLNDLEEQSRPVFHRLGEYL